MTPLLSSQIYGNWATLLLPINADESIDYGALQEEVERLVEFGVDGIYSNGSTGEFYNQTEAEFDRINEILAGGCEPAGMPFQLGASHMSPAICLERVRRAAAFCPSAIQVILPDWFVPTLEEDVVFLEKIAEAASPVGLVLYNPPHAKRVLSPEQIGFLKDAVPALVGVKVCDGDDAWYEQMRTYCLGLSIFVPGHHLASGIRQGAHGAYSNVACLHPKVAQDWFNQMQLDLEAALEMEKRIQHFMNEHVVPFLHKGYSNMAVDKMMAAAVGWAPISPRLRWPYRGVSEADCKQIYHVLEDVLPEFTVT